MAVSAGTPTNASLDGALDDVEPAVATINTGGSDLTVSAFMKWQDPGGPYLNYASTTDFANFQRNALPAVSGYRYTGDPWLTENPYAAGLAPKRMYCTGTAWNNLSAPYNDANAIALWHMDNGVWSNTPTIVDLRGPGYFLDKPVSVVSWHDGGADFGYVYVAYTSLDYVNGNTAVVVARSINGGVSFDQKTVVTYGGSPSGSQKVSYAQLAVNNANGNVYVLWTYENIAGQPPMIKMATSTDFGATFPAQELVAYPNGIFHDLSTTQQPVNTIVPNMVYNWVTGTIDVTWHDGDGTGMDIRYAYRDAAGFHAVAGVVQFSGYEQFTPALDFNSDGDVIIAYGSRFSSSTDYRQYAARIYYYGARRDPNDAQLGQSTLASTNRLGDYQTIWIWQFADAISRATASWTGILGSNAEIYLSRVTW